MSQKKRRKLWREEDMLMAMRAVMEEGVTVRQAVRQYGVPRTTLRDRVDGKVTHGCQTGSGPLLSGEEEKTLVQYCLYSAGHGFPLTKAHLLAYATAVRKKRDPSTKPLGRTWWRNFRQRHCDELTMRDHTNRSRAACAREQNVGHFYELLEKTLDENGLREKPRQIYNCNETGFQMGKSRARVLVKKGCKHPYIQALGTQENVTVLACLNAAGEDVPPFIIYEKGFPGGSYKTGAPKGTMFAKSPSGYIDTQLFRRWFQDHFLRHAAEERPLLLIFDGHKSHLDPEVIATAVKEHVVLMCLPPHMSHVLQPLDVVFFPLLKSEFHKVASSLCQYNRSLVVSKSNFALTLAGPYEHCMARGHGVAGFRKCGIFPFNPAAVDITRLLPSRPSPGPAAPGGCRRTAAATSSAVAAMPGPPTACLTPPDPAPAPLTPPEATNPHAHPLVAAGLIPPDLAEILAPVTYIRKTKRRLTVAARVITGYEYQHLIRERDEKERRAAALKERRASQRARGRRRPSPPGGGTSPHPEEEEVARSPPTRQRAGRGGVGGSGVLPHARPPGNTSPSPPSKKRKRTSAKTPASQSPSTASSRALTHFSEPSTLSSPFSTRSSALASAMTPPTAGAGEGVSLCGSCLEADPPHKSEEVVVSWVECEFCERWFHSSCVSWEEEEED